MKFKIEARDSFHIVGLSGNESQECDAGDTLTPLWRTFMEQCNPYLLSEYRAPFWQAAAYDPHSSRAIIGAEYRGVCPDGMTVETIPAATWAVFTFTSPTGSAHVPAAYTRILTEWLPQSGFLRDTAVPHLEVFPAGDVHAPDYTWEIWMPVKSE